MARVDFIRSFDQLAADCWPRLWCKREIQPEPLPVYESLPKKLPDSVLFAHDANFDALVAGRVCRVGFGKNPRGRYLGAMDAAQICQLYSVLAANLSLYVAETPLFPYDPWRTKPMSSVFTIAKSLKAKAAKLFLPGGKRGQVVSHRYTLRLVDNDRFMLVLQFHTCGLL